MTQTKGVSIEFADYREYAEGDDLRHLDWNVLARLGTPVTKTYRDEEDLAVHLLIDGSASMSFGEPTKWETACALGAALGFAALTSGDAVFPRLLGHRQEPMGALRSRSGFPRLAAWATTAKPEGANALDTELRAFAASGARTGLVVLLTDALHPSAPQALRILAGRGHEVWLVQVLSDTEIEFGFYAKGQASGQPGAVLRYIRTRFVKEADGSYRMKSMKFYSLENGNRVEEPIPGFP